jgi:hypothetical protein
LGVASKLKRYILMQVFFHQHYICNSLTIKACLLCHSCFPACFLRWFPQLFKFSRKENVLECESRKVFIDYQLQARLLLFTIVLIRFWKSLDVYCFTLFLILTFVNITYVGLNFKPITQMLALTATYFAEDVMSKHWRSSWSKHWRVYR